MKISSVKIISLLFFVLSAFYLYTAYQIQVFSFDENAPFNAKTFPIYLGYAGMFLAGLKIILPERKKEEVNHKVLDYKKGNFFSYYYDILWTNYFKSRIFLIHFNFFTLILLFSWRKKMEINDNFLIPICCYFYVFTSWTFKYLS